MIADITEKQRDLMSCANFGLEYHADVIQAAADLLRAAAGIVKSCEKVRANDDFPDESTPSAIPMDLAVRLVSGALDMIEGARDSIADAINLS